ncbi:MAG: hypothetical protein WD884_00720 [Nitrosopumilaceae archaeon]
MKSFESSQILDLVSNGHIVNQIALQENDYKISIFGVVVIGVIAALIAGWLDDGNNSKKEKKENIILAFTLRSC